MQILSEVLNKYLNCDKIISFYDSAVIKKEDLSKIDSTIIVKTRKDIKKVQN